MPSAKVIPFPGAKPGKPAAKPEGQHGTTVADAMMAHSKATGRKIRAVGLFQAVFVANVITRLAKEAGSTPDMLALADAGLRTLSDMAQEGVYAEPR